MGPPKGDTRTFAKNATVVLEVGDNKKVPATDVIVAVEEKYGKGSIYACVPRSGNLYEVTVVNSTVAEKMSTGLKIKEFTYSATLLYSDIVVVSFMHLPAYILDREIETNLRNVGVEVRSQVYRRYYPGTNVADGTRYVNIKFPPQIKSLNYLMKFNTVHGPQMFKVKHDNMSKVCSNCLSSDHLYADCPHFKCFLCGEQGHTKKRCVTERCGGCRNFPKLCLCREDNINSTDKANDEEDVIEDETKIDDATGSDDSNYLYQENDEYIGTTDEDEAQQIHGEVEQPKPIQTNDDEISSKSSEMVNEDDQETKAEGNKDSEGKRDMETDYSNDEMETDNEGYQKVQRRDKKRKNKDKILMDTKKVKNAMGKSQD